MQLSRIRGIIVCGAVAGALGSHAMSDESVTSAPEHDRCAAPQTIPPSDWRDILAARDASRHSAYAVDGGGHEFWNPGQKWRTSFADGGFLTRPARTVEGGGWSWGLELVSYGAAGEESPVALPAKVRAEGQRIVYEWSSTLSEWFVNDRRGLEHGFTVHERPASCASTDPADPSRSGNLLRFNLAVRGDLHPRVNANARDVAFVDARGAAVVNYDKLTVFDADGAIVPAWFETGEIGRSTLRIVVDDSSAAYPLTIDPVAQQAYLKASNTGAVAAGDRFGYSVAVSGDTVVVGAYEEDSNATGVNGNQASNSANMAGAAYVFVRTGGVWSQQAYLKASNTQLGDAFGFTVAVSGDTVVIGAPYESSNATGVNGNQGNNSALAAGAAYVFVRVAGVWSQQAYLKASNTEQDDRFGSSVSVSGDTIVVGAPQEDSNATGVNGNGAVNVAFESGAVYVFTRSGGAWSQQAYVKASDTFSNDMFGESVSVSGDTLVAGARFENSSATGVDGDQLDANALDSGAAYVFARVAGSWSQQAYLKASNTFGNDQFGTSVAVSEDTVVVGAYGEDSNATGVNGNQANNDASASGAAYVFARSGGVWSQDAYLKASNTGATDHFGLSVAVSGDVVIVGATNEDGGATGVDGDGANNDVNGSGAAYLFIRGGGGWMPHAYLKASNTGQNDAFGQSVAVSGDSAVVGAWSEDSNATGVNGNGANDGMLDSGAAYVFDLDLPASIPGDLNGDGAVNGADITIVLGSWGPCAGCPADINGDGVVDGADIAILLGNWTG